MCYWAYIWKAVKTAYKKERNSFMNTKSVKRYPLSKQVADKLEDMIEKGEFAVGDKINTEIELMEIFSVSRNTIREAIQSLTSAGVLEVRQGDGTYVRSSNRFNANMSMKYAKESLADINEARKCFEITIARLASLRRTDEDLFAIKAALVKRSELREDLKENTKADIEFHMEIAKACHNRILIDLYESISTFLENHIAEKAAVTHLENTEIDRLHEELYLAIRNEDPEMAGTCAVNILNI